jgi:hypothetical protein
MFSCLRAQLALQWECVGAAFALQFLTVRSRQADRDASSLPQPAQGEGPGPSPAGGVVVVDQRSKPMVLSSKVPPNFAAASGLA